MCNRQKRERKGQQEWPQLRRDAVNTGRRELGWGRGKGEGKVDKINSESISAESFHRQPHFQWNEVQTLASIHGHHGPTLTYTLNLCSHDVPFLACIPAEWTHSLSPLVPGHRLNPTPGISPQIRFISHLPLQMGQALSYRIYFPS